MTSSLSLSQAVSLIKPGMTLAIPPEYCGVAMAATRGLIDLDTPLAHYGVENGNNTWPPHWWKQVTARHLLSQTGGCVTGETSGVAGFPQCYSAPGTNWTYDSEDFIGHLSKLITKATGMPAVSTQASPQLLVVPRPSLTDCFVSTGGVGDEEFRGGPRVG